MWNFLKLLPIELVSKEVFSFLNLKSIVLLERAACGRSSRPHLLHMISECAPIHFPRHKQGKFAFMYWFKSRNCKFKPFNLRLPCDPLVDLTVVESIDLQIESDFSLEDIDIINNIEMGSKIICLVFTGTQRIETMKRIGQITPNVTKLFISKATNLNEWLTADLLANWNIEYMQICNTVIATSALVQLISLCPKMNKFDLSGGTHCSESVMRALVQHCPQLTTMQWYHAPFTLEALITLSDSTLPLQEIDIVPRIPDIPTADLPRCMRALSKIHKFNTFQLPDRPAISSFMSCFTTLKYLIMHTNNDNAYIPVITLYCKKLRSIQIMSIFSDVTVESIALLCSVNPELQHLCIYKHILCTDDIIIRIAKFCPQLRTISLCYVTSLTDIAVIALSEHCPRLEELDIGCSLAVTESAILQLLQRCKRMKQLIVSRCFSGKLKEDKRIFYAK